MNSLLVVFAMAFNTTPGTRAFGVELAASAQRFMADAVEYKEATRLRVAAWERWESTLDRAGREQSRRVMMAMVEEILDKNDKTKPTFRAWGHFVNQLVEHEKHPGTVPMPVPPKPPARPDKP